MSIRTTGVRYDVIARDSASRTFRTVGSSASTLERGLGKLGKAALVAGAALAGGIAVGLAEGAKKAVDFEASMKKIQTQAGASAKDVGVLSKQVLDLGKTTQQGPEKLSEALYHLKSVGMDNVDAMKALKTASDLAAVGGADLESTTNALAGAWRTGIKGATDFGQAAATVNAIIGAGNMTMEDLTAALGTGILPTAKTFGLTFSQVGAALALFTDEGVDSASAATRLRMSISLLAAPSRAAEKQLKSIGLTGNMLGNAMRGPDGIIGAITLLSDHLKKSGLDATHQAALLSRAFGGGKSSSAILSMVNNLDVLEKKQLQVNGSMGKYGPAVIAQRKTAAAQFALLRSNFEVFSIKAGNLLLPPITAFTTYINKTGLPAIYRYTQDLAGIVPVDKIKAGFTTATGLVGDFIDGLTPKSKKKTVTAPSIQLKAPTVPSLLRKPFVFTTPSPQIKSGKASIPKMLQVPKAQDSEAKKFGLQLRGLISGGMGDALKNAWKGIDWGGLGKTIGSGLAVAIGWVGEHIADLTKKFIKILGQIDYVQIGKSFGKMAIPLSIGIITSLFDPLFSLSFWKKHWLDTLLAVLSIIPMGKIAGPLAKLFEHIPVLKIFTPLLKGIEKIGKPIGDAAGAVTKFFGKSLWEGIARVFPEAARVLERESGLFTTRIGSWAIDLSRAGKRAVTFLGNGIRDGFGWVISKIGEGIGYIIKPFADAGSWLVKKGAAVVTGLGRGIATASSAIGRWVTDHMISPVISRFAAAGSWLLGRGSAVVAGLKSGIGTGASKIGTWVGDHVVSPVTGAFSKSGTWLVSHGRSLITGLVSGTWDALKGIGKWASSVKDKIVGAIKSVFGIHSPSRVMAELGGHMMSGLLKGLLSGKDILNAAVKGLFHSPLDAAQNLLSNGVKLPAKWMDKLLGSGAMKGNAPLGGGIKDVQNYAQELISEFWPKDFATQWGSLRSLWDGESGWNYKAKNPVSGAYGIPQALPASKMASAGSDWQTNPRTQILWGLNYIRQRYGTPSGAYGSWLGRAPHWYDQGGVAYGGGMIPKLTNSPERVLSPRQTEAFERLVGVLDGGGGNTGTTNYNIYPQRADFTVQDLQAVQRQAEARVRFGRPR